MSETALRIAINAQMQPDSGYGGVQTVLTSLVASLGRLGESGAEEYVIIGPSENPEWLQPWLGPNQRLVRAPAAEPDRGASGRLKRSLGPLRPIAGRAWRGLFPPPPPPAPGWPQVPVSDGFYEGLGCDVIHFPYQKFVLCALPSIYNPHDLQHRHFPQFFTAEQIAWRETIYRAGCESSAAVAVESQWVKDDIVSQYRIAPARVQVIPLAPPTQTGPAPTPEKLAAVAAKYGLERPFALYPAMFWEHKNHLRLFEALARLRDRGHLTVRLVCTGSLESPFWPKLKEALGRLKLESQVRVLGTVPQEDIRPLYRSAQFLVMPSLFEAASEPVYEAWEDGLPATCSNVAAMPEQVRDAALLFDPLSVEAIASAVRRIAADETLRKELVLKGRERLGQFSWERTAKAYRALYRKAAHRALTEEDERLLSWDWMREPEPHRSRT